MSAKNTEKHETGITKNLIPKSSSQTAKKLAKGSSTIPLKPSPEKNPHFVLGYN